MTPRQLITAAFLYPTFSVGLLRVGHLGVGVVWQLHQLNHIAVDILNSRAA